MRFNKILVPVDFSAHSRAAFRLATKLAGISDAEVVVAHILSGESALDESIGPWLLDQDLLRIRRMLEKMCRYGRHAACKHQLLHGDPSHEITSLAQQDGYDLIVMGTHGRSGLSRVFMGSVAESVLRTAHCPVITVKDPSLLSSLAKPHSQKAN